MNIRALAGRGIRFLLDLVYPQRAICLCCRERSEGAHLCSDCQKRLDALRLENSSVCDMANLADAQVHAVWKYHLEAAQLVRQLKFHCVGSAAEVLAEGLAAMAKEMQLPPDAIITSVTMPKRRVKQRGIDHGRMLAELTAQRLGLAYREVLIRTPGGHTQRGLGRKDRLKNLQGRFSALPLSGETVVLIDDVLTTGATAAVCIRALQEAGSGPVYMLTATRVIKERNTDVRRKTGAAARL